MYGVVLLAASLSTLTARDVIDLKGNAKLDGTILAKKPNQIVIDIGYTVLVVPRDEILSVSTTKQGTKKDEPAKNELKLNENLYYTSSSQQPKQNVRELVQEIGEAVVQIRTPQALGSGFFIHEAGYLITNFHVIEGETEISVEVYHRRAGQLQREVYKEVRIVALNKFNDLALLQIEEEDKPTFQKVPLGNTSTLDAGDRVFAIGSPMGLERTVTEGIVSTKTRQLQGELYIQTNAQINPGNSGGPLFNLQGEVVGVTNMKITFGEGLGFAIPVSVLKSFLNNRDAYAYDQDNPSNPYHYLEPPKASQQAAAK